MEVVESPTIAGGPIVRRRKKRLTTGSSGAAPGSSLSVNRNSIRVVELSRGAVGYGFTISGQKPCLLRCIVEESPAERANLRPGNCLVGVNGRDVSHLAHDEVVTLIGKCTGLLRLHVADSYFSESSDEEVLQIHQPRPKHINRMKGPSKSGLSKRSSGSKSSEDLLSAISSERAFVNQNRSGGSSPAGYALDARRPTWDPLMSSPRRIPRVPTTAAAAADDLGEESPIPELPSRNRKTSSNVESVRVFTDLEKQCGEQQQGNINLVENRKRLTKSSSNGNNNNSNNGSCEKMSTIVSNGRPSPGSHSTTSSISTTEFSSSTLSAYQAVVGYVGSIELPVIEERKRLQALTACVRRLRVERRMRSIVLLRIQSNGISLFSSVQNVNTGPPLAFYSSSIISFCGAYNEDRRFFGLVTCTNINKNCSCHVFMVEPRLLSHMDHVKRAKAFGIHCTGLPIPKNGQVLGLQECVEFPATADPILSSIVRLHRPEGMQNSQQRSPSEASVRLESTNSSNSDSGVGFRDDCDRNSARIYDIVEPDITPMKTPARTRSPLPRRKYPNSHHRKPSTPQSSTSCPPYCAECRDDDEVEISGSISDNRSQTSHNSPYSHKTTNSFNSDPASLQEILNCNEVSSNADSSVDSRRMSFKPKTKPKPKFPPKVLHSSAPPHIEVSVLVESSSPEESVPLNKEVENGFPTNLSSARHVNSRSLDNLCSQDIFSQPAEIAMDAKGNLGSTPVLQRETNKNADEFWEFKVPRPPKPKKEMNRVETWVESIEKLLADSCGREIFTEFLQHEFSAENILFYNACIRYKDVYSNLTQCQRISMASTIFNRFLQNGASDPVNVDFQARSQVEKVLSQPTVDMFDLPLGQVFNLLKFDCYPRFLRSEIYRDYSTGVVPLPQYDESDSDQDSVKSQKLEHDGRRRSLLPWNIKNRSKNKNKNKDVDRLNSDISFIQRTAMADSSDTDDGRRQSYKLCRVTLPDNSTTVLPCKPGESLSVVVQRLLEKREFHYSAFEVINVSTNKPLDLTQEVSEMSAKEIRVEPRAFVGIELPRGWRVGVRANPFRKVAEVLKPILSQHSLKLDAVLVYDVETDQKLEMKCLMGKVDGHNLLVKLKDQKLEEITNHVQEVGRYDLAGDDDDMASTKTGSSQSSSVFRGFLRRSSKKYKRKGSATIQQQASADLPEVQPSFEIARTLATAVPYQESLTESSCNNGNASQNENFQPHHRLKFQQLRTTNAIESSPLSLVSSELKLTDNSRNRKPIYISQRNDSEVEHHRE